MWPAAPTSQRQRRRGAKQTGGRGVADRRDGTAAGVESCLPLQDSPSKDFVSLQLGVRVSTSCGRNLPCRCGGLRYERSRRPALLLSERGRLYPARASSPSKNGCCAENSARMQCSQAACILPRATGLCAHGRGESRRGRCSQVTGRRCARRCRWSRSRTACRRIPARGPACRCAVRGTLGRAGSRGSTPSCSARCLARAAGS